MPRYRLHFTRDAQIHGFVVIEADHLTAAKSFGFSAVRRDGIDTDYLGGAEVAWQPGATELDDIQFEDAEPCAEETPRCPRCLNEMQRDGEGWRCEPCDERDADYEADVTRHTAERPRWADDPDYPSTHWQEEVASGDTRLGYADWIAQQREHA